MENKSVEILVNNNSIKDSINIDNLVDTILITPLGAGNSPIVDARKFFILQNHLVVYDRTANKINLYNKNGHFIKKITEDQDEINHIFQINDCWINNNGDIEVYDFSQKSIFQFGGYSFGLKKVIKSNESNIFRRIFRLNNDNGFVAYSTFNEQNNPYKGRLYHIGFLNNNFDVVKASFSFEKKFESIKWFTYTNSFFKYEDSLRFFNAFDITIYSVGSNNLEKRYKIRYLKNNLPTNLMEDFVKPKIELFKKATKIRELFNGYCYFDGCWLESKELIYFLSFENINYFPFATIVDKKTGKPIAIANKMYENLKYKIRLPLFTNYDRNSKMFSAIQSGKTLLELTNEDSNIAFARNEIDMNTQYLIEVRFKPTPKI